MIKKNHILSIAFAVVCCIYICIQPDLSFLYASLACLNAIWLSFELFNYRYHPFTLHKVVNFFILFFLVLANAIQYSAGSVVTSLKVHFTTAEYEGFQLIVLLIIASYNILYHYFFSHFNRKKLHFWRTPKKAGTIWILLLSGISFLVVLFYFKGNWMNMFFRGVVEDMAELNSGEVLEIEQSTTLIFEHFIRLIPAVCYFFSVFYKTNWKWRSLLFVFFLLSYFPLALPRNAVAMLWLPFLFLKFRIIKKPNYFVFIFLIGLLVIFPFWDNFRRFNGEIDFSISLDYMDSMSFDASQIFMAVLQKDIVTYGRQLLGALLFFVPRSIWPSKPVGSGAFLAEQQGVFSNISMPYFAEGYINFGLIGLFVFIFALVLLCSYLDARYWKYQACGRPTSVISILYFILVGAILFIMRGDLMSSFAYTVGIVFTVLFVYVFTAFPFKFSLFDKMKPN